MSEKTDLWKISNFYKSYLKVIIFDLTLYTRASDIYLYNAIYYNSN